MRSIKAAIVFGTLVMFFVISSCGKTTTSDLHLVSPANRSIGVPINQVFTCSSVANAVTYSFYFSDLTNPAGNVSSGQILTNTYSPQLISGHTYTWSVSIAANPGGNIGSDTWSFSVQ